jgi:hypothetical protein
MPTRGPFDPIAIFHALDAERVAYVVIGALGRDRLLETIVTRGKRAKRRARTWLPDALPSSSS